MLYQIKESSDGSAWGLLSTTDEINQGTVDAAIGRLRAAKMWDWNLDDLCEELENDGIEAVTVEINGVLWI